ncbi:MAG TPA: flagellar basal body P-ring protein FlgI, partial [Phenylobacterium sp.]|nr:flagellar basal body P-ring protein FlgI [Phenylobacterium sp.]
LNAQGLSREIRLRSTPGPIDSSPFHRVLRSGDALLDAWRSGGSLGAALQAFQKDSGECRKEARVVQRHLEESGVSVDEEKGKQLITLKNGASLANLVSGLNTLGVTPRDMISILQAIKAAGALQADIEVM